MPSVPARLRALTACGALLPVLAAAAFAAPVQWTGTAGGAWVRLFVDGQKATGGVEAAVGGGSARMELSGSGSGSSYSGTLQGTGWMGSRTIPLSGSWQATTGTTANRIDLTLNPRSGGTRVFSVPLRQSAYQPLFCAWTRGTVTRKPARGSEAPLSKGAELAVGDVIQTGKDSAAVVVLGDSSVVMMQESSRVEIPAVPENSKGVQKAKVATGKIWFAVKKVQPGSKFEVETDEAVAAVRGTEFLVEIDDQGETALTTAEGQVDVTDPAGKEEAVPVAPGMRWHIRRAAPGVPAPVRRGAIERRDLAPVVQAWAPLFQQADLHWPYRRLGKSAFWQNRFGPPPGFRRPGMGRRPGQGAARPSGPPPGGAGQPAAGGNQPGAPARVGTQTGTRPRPGMARPQGMRRPGAGMPPAGSRPAPNRRRRPGTPTP